MALSSITIHKCGQLVTYTTQKGEVTIRKFPGGKWGDEVYEGKVTRNVGDDLHFEGDHVRVRVTQPSKHREGPHLGTYQILD